MDKKKSVPYIAKSLFPSAGDANNGNKDRRREIRGAGRARGRQQPQTHARGFNLGIFAFSRGTSSSFERMTPAIAGRAMFVISIAAAAIIVRARVIE